MGEVAMSESRFYAEKLLVILNSNSNATYVIGDYQPIHAATVIGWLIGPSVNPVVCVVAEGMVYRVVTAENKILRKGKPYGQVNQDGDQYVWECPPLEDGDRRVISAAPSADNNKTYGSSPALGLRSRFRAMIDLLRSFT